MNSNDIKILIMEELKNLTDKKAPELVYELIKQLKD